MMQEIQRKFNVEGRTRQTHTKNFFCSLIKQKIVARHGKKRKNNKIKSEWIYAPAATIWNTHGVFCCPITFLAQHDIVP